MRERLPQRKLPVTAGKRCLARRSVSAMDGFDLLIPGFMLHAISADLNLTPTQSGSLVTWTLIGAVAGGIFFWRLSDRYGRVRVLTWTIVLFATFTGLCAFATGYWDLLIYPHHCRDRPWWRVRHRDGAGCRSMASTSPLTRFAICCVRLAGRRPACRRAYADAPAVYPVGAACSLWV